MSEFVFASVYLCSEEQLWSTRAVARMCGRLQFDIKRDGGRAAHVVARLEAWLPDPSHSILLPAEEK